MTDQKFDDATIAHMTMIQAVITRMGTNSFALKALTMTLSAAVLAFSGSIKDPNPAYPAAAILPVLVFWGMDAYYLRLERLFRRLYDATRRGELSEPFDMDVKPFSKTEPALPQVMFCAPSVTVFYVAVLLALGVVSYWLYQ